MSESSSSNNGATKILLLEEKAFSPTWKLPWVSEGFFLAWGGGGLSVGHRLTDSSSEDQSYKQGSWEKKNCENWKNKDTLGCS